MNDINDHDDAISNEPGFFGAIIRDRGVQNAAAGAAVAVGIAIVKGLLFSKDR